MKLSIIIFFLLSSFTSNAQSFLVPKIGQNKKLGLVNEKGIQVFKPIYDDIEWVGGKLFATHTRTGEGTYTNDLIYDGKLIQKDLSYKRFMIFGPIIQAQSRTVQHLTDAQQKLLRRHSGEYFDLFELNGKRLTDRSFAQTELLDTMIRNGDNHLLFCGYDIDGKYNLYEYRSKTKQLIPLMTGAQRIVLKEKPTAAFTKLSLETIDSLGRYEDQAISRGATGYTLAKQPRTNYQPATEGAVYQGKRSGSITAEGKWGRGDTNIQSNSNKVIKTLAVVGDSIFIYENYEKVKAPVHILTKNQKIVFKDNNSKDLIVYQDGDNMEYINLNGVGKAEYEHIAVYRNDYLVVQKNKKRGVMDKKGNFTLPLIYDVLKFEEDQLIFDDNTKVLQIEPSKKGNNELLVNYNSFIIVGKNGKLGLLTPEFEERAPIQFDAIFRNSTHLKDATNIILKKANKYFLLSYLKNGGQGFDYYPTAELYNYYGIKGLNIISLSDSSFNFVGYAKTDGTKYY